MGEGPSGPTLKRGVARTAGSDLEAFTHYTSYLIKSYP